MVIREKNMRRKSSTAQTRQEIPRDLMDTLKRINDFGDLRQLLTGKSSVCHDCIRFIYEKLTSRTYATDFKKQKPTGPTDLLRPFLENDKSTYKENITSLFGERNKVTLFSVVGIISDTNAHNQLHTFLVMNNDGKTKIFQCFTQSYRIEQWLDGFLSDRHDFIRVIHRQQMNDLKQGIRPLLRQYGGSTYASKKSVDTFIDHLFQIVFTNPTIQEGIIKINEYSMSIFGGKLLLPEDMMNSIYLRYFQVDLDIDDDYDPALSCCQSCLRRIDSIFGGKKPSQTQKS